MVTNGHHLSGCEEGVNIRKWLYEVFGGMCCAVESVPRSRCHLLYMFVCVCVCLYPHAGVRHVLVLLWDAKIPVAWHNPPHL